MDKRQTLNEAVAEAERTDPAVAAAAASYDEMVERVTTTFPYHYRDEDGPVCSWSGTARAGDETCPNGCEGSKHHYANDGHPECADD
jgi:hypothetical protein